MAAAVESPRPPPNLNRSGYPPPWPVAPALAFWEPVAEPQAGPSAVDTSQLLASAQAEADGICQEIRRLARPHLAGPSAASERTRKAYLMELDQAEEIYQTVERELVRLQRHHQELLQRSEMERGLRGEAERAQQAAIREQREVLRNVQERLQAANNLQEEQDKAREEAEEARDAAEASLGRLGLELVRLQSREAMLLEECAARRSSEEARAKQGQELRMLRQSAASERQRREEAEALGRERLDDMRREFTKTRQELEELREEQRSSQEKWRKQRALERENRQLRERQLQYQTAEGDARSLRVELQDALAKGDGTERPR
ncbi:Reticulocyte-binding protein 2 homolog a [Durusdinium trenchii]|uniref:Reticulocyte-binding protein 2 homolog a n=1 Tax=Durusdinium trenchii TaxID=1381693 RepID=A0ABP0N7V6_9DINO